MLNTIIVWFFCWNELERPLKHPWMTQRFKKQNNNTDRYYDTVR